MSRWRFTASSSRRRSASSTACSTVPPAAGALAGEEAALAPPVPKRRFQSRRFQCETPSSRASCAALRPPSRRATASRLNCSSYRLRGAGLEEWCCGSLGAICFGMLPYFPCPQIRGKITGGVRAVPVIQATPRFHPRPAGTTKSFRYEEEVVPLRRGSRSATKRKSFRYEEEALAAAQGFAAWRVASW
jgi:hypothetical protein